MNKNEKSKENTTYVKSEILKSRKYSKYRDLLSAILNDKENYTIEDIDRKINDFMKRRV